jgi:hypothetical protein
MHFLVEDRRLSAGETEELTRLLHKIQDEETTDD